MEQIEKKDFEKIYPISCVESYVLAYLKKRGVIVSDLYYNSFISVDHLIKDFCFNSHRYANYVEIERIQDTAVRIGILEMNGGYDKSVSFLKSKGNEFLLSIKKEYFKNVYGNQTWRDDHYVYIKSLNEEEYFYLNNNPLHDNIICLKEVYDLYNNRYIEFKQKNKGVVHRESLLTACLEKIQKEHEYRCINKISSIEYENMRDLICMLRISRQRINNFLSEWMEPDPAWIDNVNSIFAKLEYSRIRKKYSSDIFISQLDILRSDEQEMEHMIRKFINYNKNLL